ncbi:MAG: hypothetical protein FWH40_04730 [Coriobacteriia bacterium]|nr:hypothetical protein [Coriobacteriia bacterium]
MAEETIRDFSSEARSQLLYMIYLAEQQRVGLSEVIDLIDPDGEFARVMADFGYLAPIEFYEAVKVRLEEARREVARIFDDALSIDKALASRLSTQTDATEALSVTIGSLADVFTDVGDSGIEGDPMAFAARLARSFDGLLDAYYKQYVNKDGSYNWEAIESTLNRDFQDISDQEWLVLAVVYVGMKVEDTERFLRSLADKEDDVSKYSQGGKYYAEEGYITWYYDPDKVAALNKNIGYIIMEDLLYQRWVFSLSDDDVEALYNARYPGGGEGLSAAQKRNRLWLDAEADRLSHIEHSALLMVASSFGPGVLHGPAGADGPDLWLERLDDDGSYVLGYSGDYVYSNSEEGDDALLINPLNHYSLYISPANPSADAVGYVNDFDNRVFELRYIYSFAGNFLEDVGSAALSLTFDIVLLASGAALPVLPLIMTPLLFVEGEVEEAARLHEEQSLHSEHYQAVNDANYCNYFGLDAVIVSSEGSTSHIVIYYPSSRTQGHVDRLNELLLSGEYDYLIEENYENGVTVADVINNPGAMMEILDALKPEERAFVLGTE